MRNIIYSLALTLDNKIASPKGSVDWLKDIPNPDKSDYGFPGFMSSVDTTIMGLNTYQVIKNFDVPWPYSDKSSYVFTHKKRNLKDTEVEFITTNTFNFLENLKQQSGKDIWLVGGGDFATSLINRNLVDELYLHIMPLILGDGIPFLLPETKKKQLKLHSSRSYKSGVIEVRYRIS